MPKMLKTTKRLLKDLFTYVAVMLLCWVLFGVAAFIIMWLITSVLTAFGVGSA